MKTPKNLPALVLALLLAACLFTYYATRDSQQPAAHAKKSVAAEEQLVDTSLLEAALKLSPQAATAEERATAHEAWRLADHELDLSFAAALRAAQAEATAPVPAKDPLRPLRDRVAALSDRVEADQKRVAVLGKEESDDLDLAQAQLDLDRDELDDARQDLAREGGDKRARLQRLLQEHEASDKLADQAVKFEAPAPTGTMAEQVHAWFALRTYQSQLEAAEAQAGRHMKTLLEEHAAVERQLPTAPEPSASLARLRQLAELHKSLAGLDQAAQDTRQLAAAYRNWSGLVERRQGADLHLLLRSFAGILAILLAGLLVNGAVHRAFRGADRHRLHQLHVISRITLQVLSLLVILFIVFGMPTQLSTTIGLLTAGLTVVMKDFIVAFFGWFTLMGKNGIRVGDWVEIDGVSGEVIEIGILKTVLLELGNWTETGHPTGRRVSFSNSFAGEKHYFNFSTANQWLWDQLQMPLPPESDPYQAAQRIREIVERETQADADAAAADWQRVTQQYGTKEFSAGPAVSLRPGINGLDVLVRYITRAPRRNAVKSKLLREVVELLHKPA